MELRLDLFTPIHKAIRSIIYESGAILQSFDFRDNEAESSMMKALCEQLKMLKSHGEHEDNNIFNRLNEYDHDAANVFFNEHQIIDQKYVNLTSIIRETLETASGNKIHQGVIVNLAFNDFAAYYLAHMNREEEIAALLIQKYFSDEELYEMRSNIQKSIPPEIYQTWMKYMLPSLNNFELAEMFRGLQLKAPKDVFEKTSKAAELLLGMERWNKVKPVIDVKKEEVSSV